MKAKAKSGGSDVECEGKRRGSSSGWAVRDQVEVGCWKGGNF